MKIKRLFFLFFVVAICPAYITVLIDPYQLFHKTIFSQDLFLKAGRIEQFPGIVKHYIEDEGEIDTVIIGGSLSQNFDLDLTAQAFGGKGAFSFAFSGARPPEQALILDRVLQSGKIKTVFWTIDPGWRFTIESIGKRPSFPHYLYNKNRFDDLSYVFEWNNIKRSLAHAFGQYEFIQNSWSYKALGIHTVALVTAEEYGSWAPFNEADMQALNAKFFLPDRLQGIRNRLANSEDDVIDGQLFIPAYADLPASAFETEERILPDFFRKYPDVEFALLVPPMLAGYFHTHESANRNMQIYRAQKLVEMAEGFDNVHVYASADQEIMTDPRYYKDLAHYDRSISRFLLRQIANGSARQNADTVASYTDSLIGSVKAFDRQNPYKVPQTPQTITFEGIRERPHP